MRARHLTQQGLPGKGRGAAPVAERLHLVHDEVIERADVFENEAILFTHFSARYGRDEVLSLLDARLPEGLRDRVTPLLPPA